MASKENQKNLQDDDFLKEAKRLAEDDEIPAEGNFSLEEILAEYGQSREQKLWADVEKTAVPPDSKEPLKVNHEEKPATPAKEENPARKSEDLLSHGDSGREAPEPSEEDRRAKSVLKSEKPEPPDTETETASQMDKDMLWEKDLPRAPQPVSLKEVVGSTVDAVMEAQEELRPEKKYRRGLFSRKKIEDTEQLYTAQERDQEPEEDRSKMPPEPEIMDPEEPLDKMASRSGEMEKRHRAPLAMSFFLTLLLAVPMVLTERGFQIPVWHDIPMLRTGVMLVILILISSLCRNVFTHGFSMLRHRRCTGALLISLSVFVAGADCVSELFLTGRSNADPYVLPACAALFFAQWGLARESRARYDMYRTAAMSDPPYLVTDTSDGACKQEGRIKGFYSDAVRPSLPSIWKTAILPLILVATVVFAGLSSLGQGRKQDFLLCWSAILSAAASFALPLSWNLPWSALSRRLQKCGCAVAGWAGAEAINRTKTMILTDVDLFPPGTLSLNGIKVFGEEIPHVVSYAASLVRASGSGLERLFSGLLHSEGGQILELSDFSFYEEGGYSATIHGESVLLGTASFMRKMEVRLPNNLKLHTGLYLSVDRRLAAVFAVKYNVSENVDWALRMLRRNHIVPILAARDPNITPSLLKRKFNRRVRVRYPKLANRLALSEAEQDTGFPHALLLREGLMPYAETVVGCQRLIRAARNGTAIALLGSTAGTLLAFYLTFIKSFALIAPVTLLIFQLLWVLPILLLSGWAGRD